MKILEAVSGKEKGGKKGPVSVRSIFENLEITSSKIFKIKDDFPIEKKQVDSKFVKILTTRLVI